MRTRRVVAVAACVAVGAVGAARGLGAQRVAPEATVDPDERWCAPPTARSADPDSVRQPASGGGSTLVPFARDSATDASRCLSAHERLVLLARQAVDPLFYGEVLLGSGWGQWRRDPAAWRQTWAGFGRRAGLNVAAYVAYAGGESLVAGLLDVDPRPTFAPLAAGRPAFAITLLNATTLRRRDGTRVVALPRLAGAVLGGWTFAQLRPEPVNPRRVALDAVGSFGVATATHVAAEYWRWWWRRRTAPRAAGG